MEVTLIKENPDGSATYLFDMSDEERLTLLHLGIVTALKNGIEEGKKFNDDTISSEVSVGDTSSGTVSGEDGAGEQSSKPE